MKNKILVVGTGAWATALASVLKKNKHLVNMYGINDNEISDLKLGFNKKFFNNLHLGFIPDNVSKDFKSVLTGVNYIILAIPAFSYKDFVNQYKDIIPNNVTFIITSKGIEPDSKLNLYNYIENHFPNNKISSILGPSFAYEVLTKHNTYVNVISRKIEIAEDVSNLFNNEYFLTDVLTDINGSSTLSCFKNGLAILFGFLEYKKISINTKSAILSLALKEIKIIIDNENISNNDQSLSLNTIIDLCGIGDIFLTCTDNQSRNYKFGCSIAEFGVDKAIKRLDKTVEGFSFINNYFKNHDPINFPVFGTIFNLINSKINQKDVIDILWKKFYEQKRK